MKSQENNLEWIGIPKIVTYHLLTSSPLMNKMS